MCSFSGKGSVDSKTDLKETIKLDLSGPCEHE